MNDFTAWITKLNPTIFLSIGLMFGLMLLTSYMLRAEFPVASTQLRVLGALGSLIFWWLLAYRVLQNIKKWKS